MNSKLFLGDKEDIKIVENQDTVKSRLEEKVSDQLTHFVQDLSMYKRFREQSN